MPSSSSRTNVLAGSYVDRAAHRRKDPAWLEQASNDPRSLFVPVWQSQSLVSRAVDGLNAVFVERQDAVFASLQTENTDRVFLGLFRERACFAVGVKAAQMPPQFAAQFQDLRTIIGSMPREEAGLLAYARALITWRERHRFCSKCGKPADSSQGGHAVRCSDTECNTETFPRIDPAIIVLVTDGERALLGRQAAWRPGWYSTLAGFCEPGESLEDAVAREVQEESGIVVDDVSYHTSQPWPFPSSLMLGFIAHASTTHIKRDDDELEDAQWFTREQIATGEVMSPPPVSISGCLIRDWYDSNSARPLSEEPAARTWNMRAR
jgi:NAD+ diphosphatase